MSKYKRLSGKQIVKALQRMGFEQVRQRGSHVVMKKIVPEGAVGCVIPLHKEVATGTLHAILKQANVSLEDFGQNI